MKVNRSTMKCSAVLPSCFSLVALVFMASCTAESEASKISQRKAKAHENQKLASVEAIGTTATKLSAKNLQLQLQADEAMQSPYSFETGVCRQGADYGGVCACGPQRSRDACWSLRGEAAAVQFANFGSNCITLYLEMAAPTTCAPGCTAIAGNATVSVYAGTAEASGAQWGCLTPRSYSVQTGGCRDGVNYGGVCACGPQISRDACWRLRGQAAAVQFAAENNNCIPVYLDIAEPTTCAPGCTAIAGIANVSSYSGNGQAGGGQWQCLAQLPYTIEIGGCREGPEPFADYGGVCACSPQTNRDVCWSLRGEAAAVQFAAENNNCIPVYYGIAAPTTCAAGCRAIAGIANVSSYNGNGQTGGGQWQCLKSRTLEPMLELAQPPEPTSSNCEELCAQRQAPGNQCTCPCQQNTLGRGVGSQILDLGTGSTTAQMCAVSCENIGAAYFSYLFYDGSWECKCNTVYWEASHYWEGAVTGQVTCFAAPVGLPVLPDPPVRTPSNLVSAPKYNCWASADWPGCWTWGSRWANQSIEGKPLFYNSYAMSWEGFRFCKHTGSASGQEYCQDIPLDWCLAICEVTPDCIGIKWSEDNFCWMHTSALYVEGQFAEASCEGRAVFRKVENSIPIDTVIPGFLDRKCPCGTSMCQQMNACFSAELDNVADNPCLDVQEYRGNLSSLRSAKVQCDQAIQNCQQISPTCFLNMTLKWEQGLVVAFLEQEHSDDGVTQALLQRSSRAHEEGFDDFDHDHSGGISTTEFENFLESLGYQLSPGTVTNYFRKYDKSDDDALSADEWNDMRADLPVFCPCQNENAGEVSFIQGSNMEKLGLEDDLDHAYERKGRCR